MKPSRLLVVALAALAACSGGGVTGKLSTPDCNSASKFCLITCNLGCTVDGNCAVTEIAQNRPIELVFSDEIDPSSVTAGAVSLKTPNGESPAGSFQVSGATLMFVPDIRISGGVTRFGFRANETYILNLSAGSGATLRSVSGDPLARGVVCTLSVTQGLVDLDGEPPRAELVQPAATQGVPVDTQIVVRFSELINTSRFSGGSTQTSPIVYQIRRTLPDPNDPNGVICNPQFTPVLIQGVPSPAVVAGTPPRTEIALQPAIRLPNNVCVEVIVTDQVLDLAGRPAERQLFRFFTEAGTPTPQTITETFATDAGLDRPVSGGTWGGGRAIPAIFGGSGALGSFDASVGRNDPPGSATYVFNTDSQTFPADRTLFGQAITVTDGVFEFTDFVVPEGLKVVFRGSNPAVIRVRGIARVVGELSADGGSPSSNFDGESVVGPPGQFGPVIPGELGAEGGAGAGAGGRGGESCVGTGASPAVRGAAGEDARAPAASGYAGQLAGTGGRGGDVFPADGLRASVRFNAFFGTLCGMVSGGGGGGALFGAATAGRATRTFGTAPADLGPGGAGGSTVAFMPRPGAVSSLDHFLVGGAGGGGAGSHPINMLHAELNPQTPAQGLKPLHAGGAGGGGGGAIALRIGHELAVEFNAALSSRGGGGARLTQEPNGPPAPGGGGSGGSILVQIADRARFVQGGTIDVSGGTGTFMEVPSAFGGAMATARGGDGGHGYIRFEAPSAAIADLGTVVGPPAVTADHVGELAPGEGDTRSGFTSTWRPTRQLFPPPWLHYRMTCRINGQQVVFSDDPANFNPANRNDLPVRVYVQGATVNPATNAVEGQPGPWRDYVNGAGGRPSINDDSANGFRFMLIFNRDIETDVEVEEFQVTFVG